MPSSVVYPCTDSKIYILIRPDETEAVFFYEENGEKCRNFRGCFGPTGEGNGGFNYLKFYFNYFNLFILRMECNCEISYFI